MKTQAATNNNRKTGRTHTPGFTKAEKLWRKLRSNDTATSNVPVTQPWRAVGFTDRKTVMRS